MTENLDERLAEIERDVQREGSASGEDSYWLVAQLRDALAKNAELQQAHELMARQFRTMQAEKEHGWREADRHESRANAAEAKLAAARAELSDLAEHGLRADLHPTVMFGDESHVYRQLTDYLRRLDANVRERARSALDAEAVTE